MTRLTRRTTLAMAAGFAALGPGGAHAAGSWTRRASMPAVAQEIYPALWNGRIVVAGGFGVGADGVGPTAAAFLYDPETDSWEAGPDLPAPRHHPQLVELDGRLFALDGFAAEDRDRAWVMQAGGWVRGATGDWEPAPALPAPRGEAVALAHAGRLHVIGGRSPVGSGNGRWRDHGDVADHVILDPAGGAWETAHPAPTARNSAAGVVLDGGLYVVGGRRVNAGSNAELERYDPDADRWDSLRPMPLGQGGLAAGVVNGRIIAFGGEYFEPGEGGVHGETWLYDPARDAWEAGPDMLTPRHGLGGVSVGSTVYAVGGATGVGARGTSAVLEAFAIG